MKDIKTFINEGIHPQQYSALQKALLEYVRVKDFDEVKSVLEDCWNIICIYLDDHDFDWNRGSGKEISEFDDKLRELCK